METLTMILFAIFAWFGFGQVNDESMTVETEVTQSEAEEYTEPPVKSNPFVVSMGSVEVFDGISVSKETKVLDLTGRNLEGSLKAEVRHLSQLEVLNLSQNSFTGLPAEVGQLSNLIELDLSDNPFTGLPHELGNLKKLQRLVLTGTQYSEADLEVIRQSLSAETVVVID